VKKITARLIFILNVIAASLLIMSYLAPLFNPAKILFPAFFGLAYPYFLGINVIFLLYWIIRFNKYLLLSLVVISLGWSHLLNFMPFNFSGNNSHENSEEEISFLSYNVRTFDKYNWSKEENANDNIFFTINEANADIVCIQEFSSSRRRGKSEKDILKKLDQYPEHAIYYGQTSNTNSGVGLATFSKYPILKTSRIPFSNTVNLAVYNDIQIKEDTIRVFNIHLQSIRFGQRSYSFIDTISLKPTNKQIEEVKNIGKLLKDAFVLRAEQAEIIHNYILASPYPVIVAGDFNDTPNSFAYRKISKGLDDSFRKKGKGFGNTYAGELPSFRIDYILCSKDLQTTYYQRIKARYSDHFPIQAAFVFKNEE